jgi:hypothetical protein
MSSARPWTAEDRTGGELDELLALVRSHVPAVEIERFVGTYPADDDNVYWVRHLGTEVQIDTQEGGRLPFSIEYQGSPNTLVVRTVNQAWRQVNHLLTSPTSASGERRTLSW